MTALGNLLAQLDPVNKKRKGNQFEYICMWFLRNDPVYKKKFVRVWHFTEWPGRWSNIDLGTDLIAEDTDGKFWAIQTKAYSQRTTVTKAHMDSFLSDSNRDGISFRMLIATTERVGANATATSDGQVKPVTYVMRSRLEAAKLSWPKYIAELSVPAEPLPPALPHDYQIEAINAVVDGFEKSDRGQMIMACGTGKTLTALFVKEKLKADRTLVLVPSLSLMKQTIIEWTANTKAAFEHLPVCSDETVAAGDDLFVTHARDLGDRATTDPAEIANFLRGRGPRVVFCTYQSSPEIANAFTLGNRKLAPFDLAIADEAHRTTGRAGGQATAFATILDAQKIPAKRRLFMTATQRFFTGSVIREAATLGHDVATMDNEAQYGPVFHRLTFGKAIGDGLLTDYRVAIIGVTEADCRKMAEKADWVRSEGLMDTRAYMLAAQIALAGAMREHDLRRVISFHRRVSNAKLFSDTFPAVINWMPSSLRPAGEIVADHVNGTMTAGVRADALNALRLGGNGRHALLSNARCLTEGVDVPALDGVIFVDPKRSEIDIVQGVGRAIRLSPDKKLGTIVIPVFISDGDDPETILNDSTFDVVWWVVKALRLHDENLAEQLDALRMELGKPTGGKPRLPSKIHFSQLFPTQITRGFARAFTLRLINSTTASFEEFFGAMRAYITEHGNGVTGIHDTINGVNVGRIASQQRTLRNTGKLLPEREQRLNDLPGWVWNVPDAKWMKTYLLYEQYQTVNGCLPKESTVFQGAALGKWASKLRGKNRRGELSAEQVTLLDKIGFVWDVGKDQAWFEGLQHVQEDMARGIHITSTYKSDDGYPTGQWSNSQRSSRRQGKLSEERIVLLDAIAGWEWDLADYMGQFMENYVRYAAWTAEHGHRMQSKGVVVDGLNITNWIRIQRRDRRAGRLSQEKIKLLDAIDGFDWEPKAQTYYTAEEDALIRDCASFKELCRLLPNRSSDALKLRRSTLRRQHGLSGEPHKLYSPEEDEAILRSTDGIELAHQLGRTPASIRNRRYQLKGGKKK